MEDTIEDDRRGRFVWWYLRQSETVRTAEGSHSHGSTNTMTWKEAKADPHYWRNPDFITLFEDLDGRRYTRDGKRIARR